MVCEQSCGAVVVDTGRLVVASLVDTYDSVWGVAADEPGDRACLGFGERGAAGAWGIQAVGGSEIAVQVDAVGVVAGFAGHSVGVGDGQEQDCSADQELGVVFEVLGEFSEQWCTCGFVSVDCGQDEDHVGACAEAVCHNGSASDGTADDLMLAERSKGVGAGGAEEFGAGGGLLASEGGQHCGEGENSGSCGA